MPDTGAPWNIPYVEAADLVSDWPADSLLVANAVAAGLSVANVGLGTNVVSTTTANTFSASLATGSESSDMTDLATTITPSSDTNKILVIGQLSVTGQARANVAVRLLRGATAIAQGSGGTSQATSGGGPSSNTRNAASYSMLFLDSPATDLAVTYNFRLVNWGDITDTKHLNRGGTADYGHLVSTITLIEVAV